MRLVENDSVPVDLVQDAVLLAQLALALEPGVLPSEGRLKDCIGGEDDVVLDEILHAVGAVAAVPDTDLEARGELVELVAPLHDSTVHQRYSVSHVPMQRKGQRTYTVGARINVFVCFDAS